jgi:hypothetical protein
MPAGREVPEIPVRCWRSLSYSQRFPTFSSRHLGILLSPPVSDPLRLAIQKPTGADEGPRTVLVAT